MSHPAKSDVYSVPNIGALGGKRHTRQHIVATGIHKRGCDPENPAPHYNADGYACFQSDAEIREFCAKSQDTTHKWQFDASSDFDTNEGAQES